MQEKDMVLDILNGVKSSISNYAKIITETNNQNLRQVFQNMRNNEEKFQYDLYMIANQKGFYPDPEEASSQEVSSAKTALTGEAAAQQGAGPVPNMR
ncbi:MAG: spore coat protein [Clostridiales bacterium]|jgi:spore coat protein CotF|nr:spore coat protein [Clostridiales bacterium]